MSAWAFEMICHFHLEGFGFFLMERLYNKLSSEDSSAFWPLKCGLMAMAYAVCGPCPPHRGLHSPLHPSVTLHPRHCFYGGEIETTSEFLDCGPSTQGRIVSKNHKLFIGPIRRSSSQYFSHFSWYLCAVLYPHHTELNHRLSNALYKNVLLLLLLGDACTLGTYFSSFRSSLLSALLN